MRADRPLRIPLQLGTSSAASLARAAAFLVPGIILLAAPFAAFIYFFGGAADIPDLGEGAGYILFPFAIPFYFGWKHLWRSVNERASDLVLTADGFQVRGGPASGRRIAWSDLSKVAVEAKSDKGEDSDLSALWATVRGLRGPQRVCLAAAETDEEKASLVELSRTLEAGMGTRADYAPRAPATGDAVDLLVCHSCRAALVPADADRVTCAYCSAQTPVPEPLRQRIRDAADVARRPDAAVAKLLNIPGAGPIRALQALAALFMLAAWPLALLLVVRNYREHALSLKDTGFLALFVVACILGFFGLIRGRLVDRQALRLVALDFGALPPRAPGKPYLCRRCQAPLQANSGEQVLVGCVYCGCENVLGIDLHRDATVAREESLSLAAALDRRASERRRWRGVSVAAVALILVSAYSLHSGIGHNETTWALQQRCAGYDLGACNRLADLLSDFGQKDLLRDDRQRAATLYQRACQGGFAQACVNLGRLYLDTSTPLLRDPRAAKRWLTQACEFGRQDACSQLKSDRELTGN